MLRRKAELESRAPELEVAEKAYPASLKDLEKVGEETSDLSCAHRQNKAQQASNEESWLEQSAVTLKDCREIVSTLKDGHAASRPQTHQCRSSKDVRVEDEGGGEEGMVTRWR